MTQPTKYSAIDVDKLFIGGVEFTGSGTKIGKVLPLKPADQTDPEKVAKKLNELIGALKVAGLMENE